ncbi:MAG: hypothetical protein ACLTMP_00650 [Eggerthella lenta]
MEGLSFLFGGVTTGMCCAPASCAPWWCASLRCSYARSQIVQGNAHRMEAELLQSRIPL